MKILFITANRVGDAVLTTGVLASLLQQYPGAQVRIACGPYGADLFRAVPGLERLIVMKKKKWNGHWLDLWNQCKGTKWDVIVDMRNSIVSRLLRAGERYTHGKSSGRHKVIDNGDVLGLTRPPNPQIWITPQAMQEARTLLPTDHPILAFGPAANWFAKQWPVASFIALADILTAPDGLLPDASIMVLADKHEREQIEPLLQSIPATRRIEIIGRDLQTAAACLKQARLYVGNDSGLMHLAAALGTPTLGLFGPGFPEVYGPWGKSCAYVQTPETREELLNHLDNKKKISLMKTLSVERVVEAAQSLLARTDL